MDVRVDREAAMLYEKFLLAREFGWTPDEVDAMPEDARAQYVEFIAAEARSARSARERQEWKQRSG